MRTWRLEVPPEPEGVTRVRDKNGRGDLWLRVDGGWIPAAIRNGVPYPDPQAWNSIVIDFGPLVEVIER